MSLQEICGSRPWRTLAFAMLVVALPIRLWAQAPPLAEVAKKEQDRRKATATAGKVYTNKDLPKAGVPATPAKPATPTAVAEPATQPTQEKAAGDEKDEAWWRARITAAREAVRRDEMFLEALQSRVNALSTDFVNRDDPYQRAQIGQDRQKALAEMDRVKGEIEQLKKAIDDIEEEARKAGVPPGWLR
jgi:hypothetical protein